MQHSDQPPMTMPLRRPGLVEATAGNDLLLYDPDTNRAFRLNQEAVSIWRLCDGATSASDILRTGHMARTTLARFTADGLLIEASGPVAGSGVSRRDFVRLGAAATAGAVALPLIESIAGGTPASPASVCPVGQCCKKSTGKKPKCIGVWVLSKKGVCTCRTV